MPSPASSSSVTVTVRDAATGAVLKTGDLLDSGGTLDLSGIDPAAHPSIAVDARAVSADGKDAWADGIPPRIVVTWHADPRQLCVETAGDAACADATPSPLSLIASLAGPGAAQSEGRLNLRRTACPLAAPAPIPTPAPPKQQVKSTHGQAMCRAQGCSRYAFATTARRLGP